MKWTNAIKDTFKGMGESISRFPMTALFLVAIAGLNALMIETVESDYTRLIFTFVVGAMLSTVGQMIYERFDLKETIRYGLFGGAGALTLLYYFIIGQQHDFNLVILTKTGVALFALFIAFIWIPSINNEDVPFHRSFLAIIKAFFTTLLFTLVLAGGISAIFSATNYLLFNIDYTILAHLMNVLISLFAPLFFLSLTPYYPKMMADGHHSERASVEPFKVPRFLEVLISYIVIPLVAIYTLILVVYVAMNITGDFWTDNLLEPLLVSYAIIVILVLLISYNIENRFTIKFRQIFPKVLLPIVIFQTVASVLKIGEMGITHGRYYVIMFGVLAIISGVIFGFLKVKHQGYIAVALLVLAAISIIPPIDAFTISKNSQITFLEEKLTANNMLDGDEIIPKSDIPVQDKIAITEAMGYIELLGYEKDVAFLPDDIEVYNDFPRLFGFNQTYSENQNDYVDSQYFYMDQGNHYIVDILNYDVLARMDVTAEQEVEPLQFEVNGEMYTVQVGIEDDYPVIQIVDSEGVILLTHNTKEIYAEIFGEDLTVGYQSQNVPIEDATFAVENDQVALSILINSMERSETYMSLDFTLFIDIK